MKTALPEYKEKLVNDDRHEGDYEAEILRGLRKCDDLEVKKDLLKRQKIIRLKNDEFLKTLDLYRECLRSFWISDIPRFEATFFQGKNVFLFLN